MTAKQKPSNKTLAFLMLGALVGWATPGLTESLSVKQVVVVGGALTEIVFALGAADRIVAVDSTSTYPHTATQKTQIGYQRNLSTEGLLSVSPDLIIASTDAGPPTTLAQIKSSGIDLRIVPTQFSPDAVPTKIRMVAEALGLETQGQQLEARFREQWQQVQSELKQYTSRPKVLFLLSPPGSNQLMVAGRETSAEAMIKLAGGVNAFTEFSGYKPLAAEAAIAAAPDVLLIANINEITGNKTKTTWDKPGLNITPAVQKQRIIAMDPLYLLGFGPRLPEAVRELAEKIHGAGL